MRVSDTPICMVCYSEDVTIEYEIPSKGLLALCGDCEQCLQLGDREAVLQKLELRNRQDPSVGQTIGSEHYRAIINGILDQICRMTGRRLNGEN